MERRYIASSSCLETHVPQVQGLYDVDIDGSSDDLDKYLKYSGHTALDLDTNHNYQTSSQYYFPQVSRQLSRVPAPHWSTHTPPPLTRSTHLFQAEPVDLNQQEYIPQEAPLTSLHQGQLHTSQQQTDEQKSGDFSHILADVRKTCYTSCT